VPPRLLGGLVIRDLKRNGNYGFLCEADRSTKTLSLMLERYTRYALMMPDGADFQKYHMQKMNTGKSLMYSCATNGIGPVRKRFFARP